MTAFERFRLNVAVIDILAHFSDEHINLFKDFPNSASVARLVEETGSPALIFTGMYVAASVLSIP